MLTSQAWEDGTEVEEVGAPDTITAPPDHPFRVVLGCGLTATAEAVLELSSAIYNWRMDPSGENLLVVVRGSVALSGRALDLEAALAAAEKAMGEAHEQCAARR